MKIDVYVASSTGKGFDSSLINSVFICPTFEEAYRCIKPTIDCCEGSCKEEDLHRTDYNKTKDSFFAYYTSDDADFMFKIEKHEYELSKDELFDAYCGQEHEWDVEFVKNCMNDDDSFDKMTKQQKKDAADDIATIMREKANDSEQPDMWEFYYDAVNEYLE